MSLNFSANQFEEAFKSTRLQNWEVPKWFPHKPCQNHGKTHVLSNERGHLLPGVPRSMYNPWGNFIGTWDLPKNISRQMAIELSAPSRDRIARWNAHCRLCEEKGKGVGEYRVPILKPKVKITPQAAIVKTDKKEEHVVKKDKATNKKVYCPIHDPLF